MQEYSEVDWGRLTAYLANELTDDERATFERWLADDAGRQAWLARRRAEWMAAAGRVSAMPRADLGAIKAAVRARIDAEPMTPARATATRSSGVARRHEDSSRTPPRRGPFGRLGVMWTGAALVAAIAIVGLRAHIIPSYHAHRSLSGRVYATTAGQRATVQLGDGSRVVLAPRTTLTIADGFNGDRRDVTVVGQARFDVAQHADVPFIVHTGTVTTRVLGTVFDVRRYENDSASRVYVLSGKVLVQSSGRIASSATLTAGMASVLTDSAVMTVANADTASADTEWVQGRLVFHNAPVPVVLAALQRWYGYEFRLADSTLASDHITTVFQMNATRDMLQQLKQVLEADMTFRDSVVTLVPRHGASWHDNARRNRELLTHTSDNSREVGR